MEIPLLPYVAAFGKIIRIKVENTLKDNTELMVKENKVASVRWEIYFQAECVDVYFRVRLFKGSTYQPD